MNKSILVGTNQPITYKMSTKPFQFKEFTIHQNKTAMKIGTDGVLLGAWVELNKDINNILDIGTGTGIIALQIAQRSNCQIIDAVEIEPDAYEQAVDNFENSNWGDRLFCYHAPIQKFTEEIDEKYDLIISNPPFYNDTYKKVDPKRAAARHTEKLSFAELLTATAKLLSQKGSCSFIIPFREENNFLNLAQKVNLYPNRITRVKGNIKTPIKRTLLQLSFNNISPAVDELIIEIERHEYSVAYNELVRKFYLNL